MRVSWVLSDEERNRRFNKFHKLRRSPGPRRPGHLWMVFTMEEQKLVETFSKRFGAQYDRRAWLQTLLHTDRYQYQYQYQYYYQHQYQHQYQF